MNISNPRVHTAAEAGVSLRYTSSGTPIRFSVCIPNYNYARYIGATIESVLAQTYPHFEIIVADNASTDDSLAVVGRYHDSRIRVIRNSYNVGFAPNLDRATEPARFEFMILLSSDDLMHPNALEVYAKVLSELGGDADQAVLTSAADVINSSGELIEVSYRKRGTLFYRSLNLDNANAMDWKSLPVESQSGREVLAASLRAKDTVALFLATCYPRKLYDKVLGYRNLYRILPDGGFLDKVLSQDSILVYVPNRLFVYRQHQENQLAQETLSGALKYQVDAYMRTAEFPSDDLERLGVKRQELIDVFIRKSVMERGLQALVGGSSQRAGKCLAFGFATYPGAAFREPRTYALVALLCLGPLGKWLARSLYRSRTQRRAREEMQ